MAKPQIKIVKDPEDPQQLEVLEKAIVDIAEGARKMLGGRLKPRTIYVLLKDASGESLDSIQRILYYASQLDKAYLKVALFALVAGLSACAPRVVNCNREAQWWASGADGKINTQIKVCFRDDGSLGYRAEPFVPPPAAATAAKAADPVAAVKKIVDELKDEIAALKTKPAPAAPEPPKVTPEAMAAKRAAAAKLKP